MLRMPLAPLLASICTLGAAIGGGVASAEELTLRFRPDPGATFKVLQEIGQDTTMDILPMGSQRMRSDARVESTQTVLSPAASGARRIEFVFDRMTMSTKSGDVEVMGFDTADDEGTADPSMAALNAIAGKSYIVEFDELGVVVGMEGLTEMIDQLVTSAGDAQAQAMLQQMLSEDSMRQTIQMSTPVFPEKQLAIGEKWSREFEMNIPLLGTIGIEATYTYESLDEFGGEECVRLKAEMAMEFEFDGPMLEQLATDSGSGADIRMDADDSQASGSMCVARSDGVTLESKVENQLAMRIGVATGGQDPMEMRVAVDQVTHYKATR